MGFRNDEEEESCENQIDIFSYMGIRDEAAEEEAARQAAHRKEMLALMEKGTPSAEPVKPLMNRFGRWYVFQCPNCGHEIQRETTDKSISYKSNLKKCPYCESKLVWE